MNDPTREPIDRLLMQIHHHDVAMARGGRQSQPLPREVLRALWEGADAGSEVALPALPVEAGAETANPRILPLPRPWSPRGAPRLLALAALVAVVLATGIWLALKPVAADVPTGAVLCRVSAGGGILRHAGASQSVSAGADLRAGDELTSRDPGTAIRYADGSVFALAAGTRWRALAPDPGQGGELAEGRVEASVAPQPQGRPLTILTAAARIEVIGTRFTLSADRSTTALELHEGTVRLTRTIDRSVTVVHAGERVVATLAAVSRAPVDEGREWRSRHPEWIWCDDFESDQSSAYFEYDAAGGAFQRVAGVGVGGSSGMRAIFRPGQPEAGALRLAFGRTPAPAFRAVGADGVDLREIYWRFYLRNQPGWIGGGGGKLTQARILANALWAEAASGNVWSSGGDVLVLDPVSGTDVAGVPQTASHDDDARKRWLGQGSGTTPFFAPAQVGVWHCIEAHMRLNDPGVDNGLFELWVDGRAEVSRADLNWVGAYRDFGINALFLENFWHGEVPQVQERYIDNLVVSTKPIGPLPEAAPDRSAAP